MNSLPIAKLVFSPEEIKSFEEWGYVRIKEAFSRDSALAIQDFMWAELYRLHGFDKQAPATWQHEVSLGLNKTRHHPIYNGIGSPRMFGAIDQLLGVEAWSKPQGWGGFLVTFPEGIGQAWDVVNYGWHWDGDPGWFVDGLHGLQIFTFFSNVAPGGGGTLIAAGTHRLIKRFFQTLMPDHLGRKQKMLKRRFTQSHPWLMALNGESPDSSDSIRCFMEETTVIDDVPVKVVELTGEPGDAVICHGNMLHARSFNYADVPRFMRVGGAGRKDSRP